MLFLLALVLAAQVLLVATNTVATNPVACANSESGACDRKDNHRSPRLEYFIQELPIIPIAKPSKSYDGDHEPRYDMTLDNIEHKFHPHLKATNMLGFNGIHPGPTIEAQTNQAVKVDWHNNLFKPHPLGFAIDPTLDNNTIGELPEVRNTIHNHGAHVQNTSDGLPTSWVTPGHTLHYRYPNQQPPLMGWYHDHAHGITRLNVYAGLAGFYHLRTPGLDEKLGLPTGKYEIPLILQDKFFNEDGSLYYPTTGHGHNPIWVSDLEADTPVVNGAVAPYLKVEPRKYRFRILNGANYREWNLHFQEDNLHFTQVGGDGGFLPKPVVVREVPLSPAERADVIVDFSAFEGRSIILRNNAPLHEADFSLSKLMRFDVLSDVKYEDRTPIASQLPFRPIPPCIHRNRTMTLSEPNEIYLMNNRLFLGPVDTHPIVNTTEIWRIINLTNETHPVHVHLGEFKLLKRCPFETERWLEDDKPDDIEPYIKGPCGHHNGVLPGETGHKDVFRHLAQTVTIIKLPFDDFVGTYVMHCHKLEHEDNDMMNPWESVEDHNRTCIDYVAD
jgi:spore coat protein A